MLVAAGKRRLARSTINPFHALPYYFLKISFNIILPYVNIYPTSLLPSDSACLSPIPTRATRPALLIGWIK
jgi:hypothetical protein